MEALSNVVLLVRLIIIKVVRTLVDLCIAALDDQTVCWDSTSCSKKYDVTNNEVPNADAHGGSKLTSDDSNRLLFDERLQVDKRLVLEEVSNGCDADDCECSDDDGDTFNESAPSISDATAKA